MRLTEAQEIILDATEPKIAVLACAASLKTSTLIEKVRRLLQEGNDPNSIAVITFTRMAAQEMIERLGEDFKPGLFVGTIHALAAHFLSRRGLGGKIKAIAEEEDFDKLFDLCKNLDLYHSYEWLCVDEAQDCGEKELEFMFDLINPEHYFCCMDFNQCQPAGTKILMSDKSLKNIEDVQIGDSIFSYSKHSWVIGGNAHNAKKTIITNKSSRIIRNEELIQVITESGKVSTYTKNHIAISNLCLFNEYNFLTYLMCDERNRFRIGTSQFRNTNTNPWRAKMRAEGCKKIWILDSFKTNKEARILEDKLSYKYKIPQITFQLDKTTYTSSDIDFIYEGLDTYSSAKECLKDYHRDINFPFATLGDNNHYASNSYNKCYACNLLPHNMQMLVYDPTEKHRCKPENIREIKYIPIQEEEVFCLEVNENHTYIADDIITHNCIYKFKGACPELLKDYMNRDATIYKLNENFRNGADILDYAKGILKKGKMKDTSTPMRPTRGVVTVSKFSANDLIQKIKANNTYGDWAVLCRTNREVDMLIDVLEDEDIPVITFKQGDLNRKQLEEIMNGNKVKVLTAHSSKGLAWKNVVMYKLWNGSPEELRLKYVAATRAKDWLIVYN